MPNVVLITSDQHRGDCFGFAGRRVKTPVLDRMSRDGTRFDLCLTPNVVCQPARASLLTGLLPGTHGVVDNGYDLPTGTGEAGFAGRCRAAGLRTGFIGKAHFATSHTFAPTGSPECRESSARYGADWFGPYMGFEHVELVVEGHNNWLPMRPPRGQHYERWYYADGDGDTRNRLYQTHLSPDVGAVQTWSSALPIEWHNSTWVTDRSVAFLADMKARNENFVLWASYPDPHHPFDAPAPWCFAHHPDEVDLPPHRTLDLERRPWWHAAAYSGSADPRVVRIRGSFNNAPPQTDLQLRHLIANYYGMIALIDACVGRLLESLEWLDLKDDTYVIFTSDHGEWLGDHGLMFKGPMLYEGLVRVGLIVTGPTVPAGQVIEEPVSTLDLAATIAGLAGADASGTQGTSLQPMLGLERPTRDFAYNEWDLDETRCGVALNLRLVRTKRYKLCIDALSGAGELYDLHDDPFEAINRYDDPGLRSVQSELQDMIASRPAGRCEPQLERVGMA